MSVEMTETKTIDQHIPVSFGWLEITGKCCAPNCNPGPCGPR